MTVIQVLTTLLLYCMQVTIVSEVVYHRSSVEFQKRMEFLQTQSYLDVY